MRIENFRKETKDNLVKAIATVIWEDRDRPSKDLYFETTAEYGDDLFCNPNSFLLTCTLPAMRYGEKRIALDAPICPELKDGLITAMNYLIDWHGGDRRVIPIEAPLQSQALFPHKPPRAGCLFSGGIDALAMLRDNHLNFPPEHPRYIQDGILVYGVLNGEDEFDPSFQNVINAISMMAKDAGINLIQVNTNTNAHLRDLDSDYSFWRFEYHGSFLAAIAHAFAPRLTTVSIASTYDIPHLEPWGSHPLIDPLYSNTNLQIRHENAALSRLDKTKLVGEWDVALKHLRVCNEKESYSQGNSNCGKCEKCVRTMTALLALGILDKTSTFRENDVSKKLLLDTCYLSDSYEENCYRELIEPLKQIGRDDLADGVQQVITRYQEKDFKGLIKRFDRAFLNGNLLSYVRAKKKEKQNS
ncbi:MAG: hypothetical protein QNJ41_04025 [Xenococcaceae cyanobacterium MO_188.B32]|nr:hypothetical protein [Xenococcaceae cyanobacterium MO_188.B32]